MSDQTLPPEIHEAFNVVADWDATIHVVNGNYIVTVIDDTGISHRHQIISIQHSKTRAEAFKVLPTKSPELVAVFPMPSAPATKDQAIAFAHVSYAARHHNPLKALVVQAAATYLLYLDHQNQQLLNPTKPTA